MILAGWSVVVVPVASALLIGAATALAANIQGDGTLVGSTGNDNINAGNGNDQKVMTRSTAARSATPSTPRVRAMTPSTSAPAVVTR